MSVAINQSLGVMETTGQSESFAERLKRLRQEKKLNQEDIATLLNMQQAGYSKYENRTYKRVPRDFVKIAKILGVTPQYLLHGKDIGDDDLIRLVKSKFKDQTSSSTCLTQEQVFNGDLEGQEALILKAGNSKDYVGELFTFEINHRRFSPKYMQGDKITFNKTLKPESGVDVIYIHEDSLLIGTFTQARDGYKIEALNNLCEDLYSVEIIGVIIQVVKSV